MEKFRTSLISNMPVSQFYLPRYQPAFKRGYIRSNTHSLMINSLVCLFQNEEEYK